MLGTEIPSESFLEGLDGGGEAEAGGEVLARFAALVFEEGCVGSGAGAKLDDARVVEGNCGMERSLLTAVDDAGEVGLHGEEPLRQVEVAADGGGMKQGPSVAGGVTDELWEALDVELDDGAVSAKGGNVRGGLERGVCDTDAGAGGEEELDAGPVAKLGGAKEGRVSALALDVDRCRGAELDQALDLDGVAQAGGTDQRGLLAGSAAGECGGADETIVCRVEGKVVLGKRDYGMWADGHGVVAAVGAADVDAGGLEEFEPGRGSQDAIEGVGGEGGAAEVEDLAVGQIDLDVVRDGAVCEGELPAGEWEGTGDLGARNADVVGLEGAEAVEEVWGPLEEGADKDEGVEIGAPLGEIERVCDGKVEEIIEKEGAEAASVGNDVELLADRAAGGGGKASEVDGSGMREDGGEIGHGVVDAAGLGKVELAAEGDADRGGGDERRKASRDAADGDNVAKGEMLKDEEP